MATREFVIVQTLKHVSAAAVAMVLVAAVSLLITAVFGVGVSLFDDPAINVGTQLNDTQ